MTSIPAAIWGVYRKNFQRHCLKNERLFLDLNTAYYPLFLSTRGKLSCKKSSLVWCEILRLFVNAVTAEDKYSGSNILHLWNVHEI